MFHCGTSSAQYFIMSVMIRRLGSGGKMYSFCAMYSFRMSFCTVPRRSFGDTPCDSAAATYIASTIAAGELIVIDVDTLSRGMPWKRRFMSSRHAIATPHFPTSPSLNGWSES
ncbi:MAG: hypothetical protein HMLKMBBP_03450 [Planctomycetes bacterium]|nr:hypothetical protein [Planctomycetota bacterium]